MYLSEEDNKRILDIIDENFKSCTVFTEIMPPVSVKNVRRKSVEEMDAKLIGGVQKGNELLKLNSNFKWIKDVNLFDGMNVFKPITKLFTWIPFIRNRMDYIVFWKNNFKIALIFIIIKLELKNQNQINHNKM